MYLSDSTGYKLTRIDNCNTHTIFCSAGLVKEDSNRVESLSISRVKSYGTRDSSRINDTSHYNTVTSFHCYPKISGRNTRTMDLVNSRKTNFNDHF